MYEDLYYIAIGVLFLAMAGTWIAFARLTMGRIERDMRRDGHGRPAPWDGIGFRALWYASALVSRWGGKYDIDDPLIDKDSVRAYSTPADRKRAKVFLATTYSWAGVLLVGGIIFRIWQ